MPVLSSWLLLRNLAQSYLAPYKKQLMIAIFCMISAAISTALLASYLKPIFNDIFIARRQDLLTYVAGGVLAIFIMKGFSEYGASLCLESIGQKMVTSLQQSLFSHVIFLDLNFFHKEHEGHITSLFLNDTRSLKNSVLQVISSIVKEGLTVLSLLFVMIKENRSLTFWALLGLPLVMGLLVGCGRRVRLIAMALSKETAALQAFFQQVFQNITLVKACHTEAQEINSLTSRLKILLDHTIKVGRIRAFIHPIMEILGGLAVVCVILSGGMQVIKGTQTTGSFLAFITALFFIYRPMKSIIHLNTQLQEGLAAAQRIHEVMTAYEKETHSSRGVQPPIVFCGSVTFEGVTFSYHSSGQPLLQNFSCTFEGQKRIALVGPSGAGKTTLFHLLLRFYRPQAGRILWGGVDISTMDLEQLRKNIALVSQDIVLFDETIAYNIAYGRPQASLKDIKRAASLAFADEFIESLPHGYETYVGPNGVKLSGGQRQRLALARAFLLDAPLLLLDEATSALDNVSEKKIQQATQVLTDQRTTLIIAHRLSTIENADYIYVMNKGGIVEQGTHRELIAKQGFYHRLALFQSSEGQSFPEI